jgi:MbtH protein
MQALPTQDEIDAAQGWFVVQNHEGQYAIWPHGRDIPLGWNVVGPVRSKREALDHLNEIGADMRPQSLRRRMEEMERSAAGKPDG